MNRKIIDAHSHLWLRQDTVVDGLPIRTLTNGRSLFMGEIRQMVPPFIIDGRNTAEIFLSNMDYAQVSAAVVTQEFIDGMQNDYLLEVANRYPDRFFVCGLCEFRRPGYAAQARELAARGFKAIKVPAQRLLLQEGRVCLNGDEMMEMFHFMENKDMILSVDLADGDSQTGERTFRYGYPTELVGADQPGTLPERPHRIRRYHLVVQRRILSFPRCR